MTQTAVKCALPRLQTLNQDTARNWLVRKWDSGVTRNHTSLPAAHVRASSSSHSLFPPGLLEQRMLRWWESLRVQQAPGTLSDGRFYQSLGNTKRDGHFCHEKHSICASLACERRTLPHFRLRAETKPGTGSGAMPLTQAHSFFFFSPSQRFKIYVSPAVSVFAARGFSCDSVRGWYKSSPSAPRCSTCHSPAEESEHVRCHGWSSVAKQCTVT